MLSLPHCPGSVLGKTGQEWIWVKTKNLKIKQKKKKSTLDPCVDPTRLQSREVKPPSKHWRSHPVQLVKGDAGRYLILPRNRLYKL